MWAAAEGHAAVVKALIAHGANVNAVSEAGFTPLMFAAVRNDAESVRALLAAGVDPNASQPKAAKPLMLAAAYRSTAAAGALIDGGADASVKDRAGNAALHTAAQAGDLDLVKMLLSKGVDVNVRTADTAPGGGRGYFRAPAGRQTPLMLAARGNHVDVMRALIAAGADPKAKAQDNSTFLMAAVGSGRVSAVKFAYEHDQDVKVATTSAATLMHAAVTGTAQGATQDAQERVCEVIRFLAQKGAPLDEKNDAGRTPIDLADILPIDLAVDLLTDLIIKSGNKPKSPSKR
jgi:ankyrin repeat protein